MKLHVERENYVHQQHFSAKHEVYSRSMLYDSVMFGFSTECKPRVRNAHLMREIP